VSLDNIIAKIVGDAQTKAQELDVAGRAKVEALLSAAQQQAFNQGEGIVASATARVAEEEARLLTAARLEARKQLLSAKQAVMEEAFFQALADLRARPLHEQRRMLAAMLQKAVETGEEQVVYAKEDSQIFASPFLDDVNAALKAQGKHGHLTLAPECRPTGGGFYLLGDGLEINATFPTLIKSIREQLEPEVAAVLFS